VLSEGLILPAATSRFPRRLYLRFLATVPSTRRSSRAQRCG